jgi:hypothetical protein
VGRPHIRSSAGFIIVISPCSWHWARPRGEWLKIARSPVSESGGIHENLAAALMSLLCNGTILGRNRPFRLLRPSFSQNGNQSDDRFLSLGSHFGPNIETSPPFRLGRSSPKTGKKLWKTFLCAVSAAGFGGLTYQIDGFGELEGQPAALLQAYDISRVADGFRASSRKEARRTNGHLAACNLH